MCIRKCNTDRPELILQILSLYLHFKDWLSLPSRCVICMMDFEYSDPIRFLPCLHIYHVDCIDPWLMRSFTCPSCMEPVDAALLSTYETNWAAPWRDGCSCLNVTAPFKPKLSSLFKQVAKVTLCRCLEGVLGCRQMLMLLQCID